MGFDLDALRLAVQAHGRVARVVVADIRGSVPREVGASMLVWSNGQNGTIGGGALEHEAAQNARAGASGLSRHALGPDLGQCCGGAVTLLSEQFEMHRLEQCCEQIAGAAYARPTVASYGTDVSDTENLAPLAVRRVLKEARGQGVLPEPQLMDGWMVEPLRPNSRPLWVWGAGHVGRAMVAVLAPLDGFEITWIDTAPDRFPEEVPAGVTVVPAESPADLADYAPVDAAHLIVTFSHTLDLEICHRLLMRGFDFAGLIGSKTKWARFRSRLAALGHGPARIGQITCPIGDPALGKQPQAIAIGVAARLLTGYGQALRTDKEIRV